MKVGEVYYIGDDLIESIKNCHLNYSSKHSLERLIYPGSYYISEVFKNGTIALGEYYDMEEEGCLLGNFNFYILNAQLLKNISPIEILPLELIENMKMFNKNLERNLNTRSNMYNYAY